MRRSHPALSRFVACGVLLCGGASVPLSTAGRAPGLSTIDVPGASFTSATGINPQGDIVGQCDHEAGRRHGFLLVDGAFTTIDYPNAVSTGALASTRRATSSAIIRVGSQQTHGYLLSRGTFSTIDYPGSNVTRALGISATGDVVGDYRMPGDPRTHAFVLVR